MNTEEVKKRIAQLRAVVGGRSVVVRVDENGNLSGSVTVLGELIEWDDDESLVLAGGKVSRLLSDRLAIINGPIV